MNKKDRNTNKKVLAMYQAVIELVEAQVDITSLKVADITQKAGIGKGTAYEYFSSKEEIIEEALHWNLQKQLDSIKERLMQAKTMKEQIFMGWEWIEQSVPRRSIAIQMMRMPGHIDKMEQHCEQLQEVGIPEVVKDMCNLILETGRKEGIVSDRLPDFMQCYVIICNCVGFFCMMNQMQKLPDTELADMKNYIYETIVKSLQ